MIIYWGGGGVVIIFVGPKKQTLTLAFKLTILCTNIKVEYKALILGMVATLNMRIASLIFQGNSNLVIKQMQGEFAIKELALTQYDLTVQRMVSKFEYVPRIKNKYAGALAMLTSKVTFQKSQN